MPGVVTVACKLPHGFLMRLSVMEERQEPAPGGGTRTVKVAMPVGEAVRINGAAVKVNEPYPEHPIVGGYALTHNVDADLFAKWLAQYADWEPVKQHLVFAHPKDAASMAREGKDLRSGLEPLDPEKPGAGLSPLVGVR